VAGAAGCLKQVEEYMKSDKGKKEVLDEITHNMWRRNISGVPHFVFTSEKGLLYVGARLGWRIGHARI